jgi:hypothetical protein
LSTSACNSFASGALVGAPEFLGRHLGYPTVEFSVPLEAAQRPRNCCNGQTSRGTLPGVYGHDKGQLDV